MTTPDLSVGAWRVQHVVREGGHEEWRAYGPFRASEEEAQADAEHAAMRGALPEVHPSNMPTIIDVLESDLAVERDLNAHSMRERERMAGEIDRLSANGRMVVALLRRIIIYAREDKARTPGTTRLARALAEAERLIGDEPTLRVGTATGDKT